MRTSLGPDDEDAFDGSCAQPMEDDANHPDGPGDRDTSVAGMTLSYRQRRDR